MAKRTKTSKTEASENLPLITEADPADKSKETSTPPPKPALTPLQATLGLIKRGYREYLPRLRELLRNQPEVWQQVGNLARITERMLIERIGGQDDLLKESLVLFAESLRNDLAGPDPEPLERVIVERLVTLHLQTLYLDAMETEISCLRGDKSAEFLMRRQQQAHHQLMGTAKTLEIIRRLRPQKVIEIAPVPTSSSPAPDHALAHDSASGKDAPVNGHAQNGSSNHGFHNRLNGFKLTEVGVS